tara:strand:+ start:779 stop:1528 length:750 start_codon:yes stop_codon:yes gene_type:complete
MEDNKLKLYRVKDKNESYTIKKRLLFNIPFRLLLNAKSGVGKTSFIVWLLLNKNKECYKDNFKGDNIYIFSPSIHTDYKLNVLISNLDIPDHNLFESLDMDMLEAVYEMIKEDYSEKIRNKEKPENTLIIIDDCMDALKNGGKKNILDKMAANCRHQQCSFIISSQYYNKFPPTVRSNANGVVIWDTSDKILEQIAEEHSTISHKAFKKMFRDNTNDNNYSFIIINYTNKKKERYLNDKFEVIDINKYE